MLPVPLGGLAVQEGAALFVFLGAQILKKIQNGHNTNHGLVVDFTQSPEKILWLIPRSSGMHTDRKKDPLYPGTII